MLFSTVCCGAANRFLVLAGKPDETSSAIITDTPSNTIHPIFLLSPYPNTPNPLNPSPHKPLLSPSNYQITAYYLLTTTTSSGALPTSFASKDTPASPPGEPRKTYAEGSRVGCDHAAGGLTRTRDSSSCSYTSGMASSPGNSIATRAFAWLNARWIE